VADSPSLTVQVVLYETGPEQVRRPLRGVARAARRAVDSDVVSAVSLAYGDCSASECLDADDLDDVNRHWVDHGLAGMSYEWFGKNLGSAGGSNRLAGGRSDPLFLVLNPDTYPDPDLLCDLVAALGPPDVAAADARQIPCEHPKAFAPGSGDTSWVSGAAMLVRRAAFDEVGGFDADVFPLYGDDVDLSWRLRRAGWRVVHASHALVFHDKRPRAGGVVPTPSEDHAAALARLLLCRRWGRPDLEAETIDYLASQPPSSPQRSALAAYEQRAREGRLPAPLDGAGAVARFEAGNYAVHRF
jgi:hypothetical protein